jgi:hypothetical protein
MFLRIVFLYGRSVTTAVVLATFIQAVPKMSLITVVAVATEDKC